MKRFSLIRVLLSLIRDGYWVQKKCYGMEKRPGMGMPVFFRPYFRISILTAKPGDKFHMGRPWELIDGQNRVHLVAAIDKDACVSCEGRRIARHARNDRRSVFGQTLGLRLGTCARRIENDSGKARQVGSRQRIAKQIAYLWRDMAVANGIHEACIPVNSVNGCASGKAQRKGSQAAKQIGHGGSISDNNIDARGNRRLAFPAGLKKRPRRRRNPRVAHFQNHRSVFGHGHDLIIKSPTQPRQIMVPTKRTKQFQPIKIRRLRNINAHVRTVVAKGHGNIAARAGRTYFFHDTAHGIDKARNTLVEKRALHLIYDLIAGPRVETDDRAPTRDPVSEYGPAACSGRNRYRGFNGDILQAALRQSINDALAFPFGLHGPVQVLKRTTAAIAEMWTGGFNPFACPFKNFDWFGKNALAGPPIDPGPHPFARQREGNKQLGTVPFANPVATRAQGFDGHFNGFVLLLFSGSLESTPRHSVFHFRLIVQTRGVFVAFRRTLLVYTNDL